MKKPHYMKFAVYIHETASAFSIRNPNGKTLCTVAKPYQWDFQPDGEKYKKKLDAQRNIAEWITESLRKNPPPRGLFG